MRPKKYVKARLLTICLDDKDVSYLDDHRGKVTRGDYLKESMYALKGEQSEELKTNTEKIKQLSAEIHELKRLLLFEQSKTKRLAPIIEINEAEVFKFFEEKNISSSKVKPNFENLFDKNRERLLKAGVTDAKVLENLYKIYSSRNNNHLEGSAIPLEISPNLLSQGVTP